MKNILILFALITLTLSSTFSFEENADSIIVQTLNFDDITKRTDSYLFPPLADYEKIMMIYTLKCDPRTTQDGFDCGEWDYLTYTFVTDSSGREKINRQSRQKYRIGQSYPDFVTYSDISSKMYFNRLAQSAQYEIDEAGESIIQEDTDNETFTYKPGLYLFQYEKDDIPEKFNFIRFDGDIASMSQHIKVTAYIMDYQDIDNFSSNPDRLDYAGKVEGSINELGVQLNETISKSDMDSGESLILEVFIPDYLGNTELVLDSDPGGVNALYIEDTSVGYFDGSTHFEVPAEYLSSINNEVTISFWARGDGNYIPKNTSVFEASNSQNQRILNLHFPWSNGRVYWDAGNDGNAYDRIDVAVQEEIYADSWNHWTLTKNSVTGSMKIYINGELFHENIETNPKNNSMANIDEFIIGANRNLGNRWQGSIRDFAIWDKELSLDDIVRNKKIGNDQAGDYLVHYSFTNGVYGIDPNGNNALSLGELVTIPYENFDYSMYETSVESKNVVNINRRPRVGFNYQSLTTEISSEVQMASDPVNLPSSKVILYDHQSIDDVIDIEIWETENNRLNSPTDTLDYYITRGWDYIYDYKNGSFTIIDSVLSEGDIKEIGNEEYYWYSPIINYEIDRFITPYGIGLDLGDDGFTWKIDVTDYAPILHDWVKFTAGNQQELIDVKFVFIKGTPARDIVDLKTIYRRATYKYPQIVENSHLPPTELSLNSEASMWRVKTRSSGHRFGQDGTDNCAEFCNRLHSVWVDGSKEFEWEGWRECGDNPIFPQGGTWLADRTDWCPGQPVTVYNHEITSLLGDKSSVLLDYEIEEKPEFTSFGDWVMNGMLVEYGEPNFQTNVEIVDILAPSNHDEYSRWNPVCDDARVLVSNQGSNPITSLDFNWEIDGVSGSYRWEGNLEFLEQTEVVFPLDFTAFQLFDGNQKTFEVEIVKVNDGEDEYPKNNLGISQVEETDNLFQDFVMELRTNNWTQLGISFAPMNYGLYNLNTDETIFEETNNLPMNTVVKEEETIDFGCYQIILENEAGYGLSYWVLDQYDYRTGMFRLSNSDNPLKTFETEFGNSINYQFRVTDKVTAEVDREVLNFGQMKTDETKILSLEIGPANDLPLTISSLDLGFGILRGFSIVSTSPSLLAGPAQIMPGEKMMIDIELKAKDEDLTTAELIIETNDARNNSVVIDLIANGQTSVNIDNDNLRLSVSPNPINGPFTISYGIETGSILGGSLALYNSLGEKIQDIYSGDISIRNEEISMQPNNLSSGIYYLTLKTGTVSKTIPIVVNN